MTQKKTLSHYLPPDLDNFADNQKDPDLDRSSYSKWAQDVDANTFKRNLPTLPPGREPLSPRPHWFPLTEVWAVYQATFPHFSQSHIHADQWHLVQYFIKSSWKLTVQSVRKVRSLSNINYAVGCGCSTPQSPFATDTRSCRLPARSRCKKHNLSTPPSDGKHWKLKKVFSKKSLFRSRMNDFCVLP